MTPKYKWCLELVKGETEKPVIFAGAGFLVPQRALNPRMSLVARLNGENATIHVYADFKPSAGFLAALARQLVGGATEAEKRTAAHVSF